MSLFSLDINGQHLTVDDSTGNVYDAHHDLVGHYDSHTHDFSGADGNILAHVDPSHHQIFDANHNLLGGFGHNEITHQDTFSNPSGNMVGGYDPQFGQIFDSAFNVLGQLRKLW